jgi:hypothetical protein
VRKFIVLILGEPEAVVLAYTKQQALTFRMRDLGLTTCPRHVVASIA